MYATMPHIDLFEREGEYAAFIFANAAYVEGFAQDGDVTHFLQVCERGYDASIAIIEFETEDTVSVCDEDMCAERVPGSLAKVLGLSPEECCSLSRFPKPKFTFVYEQSSVSVGVGRIIEPAGVVAVHIS
jgi:hypothetical protein